ncbi:ADP-ribosylation factor-like protein 6-interacting protein 4 [Rana temporaria]|uniref:ADP-ribosylation factor-like protein 6-interacting protein 4 n=1 Tax=Rana temporaria TaxID=8407 RepID=UPI001AADD85B|nr:ADP-ribosylation factor-like protein 6-interacting protein 4 [Rana temporaria]
MDDTGTKKKPRSRSPHPSHHKSVKKKSASRHRGDSSSPSPSRRRSTLSKYHPEVLRKERKRGKRKLSRSSSSSSSSSPERKKKKNKAAKSSSSSSSSTSSDSSSSSSSSSDESSDCSKHKRHHKKKKYKKGKKKKKLKKKSKKAKKNSLSKVKVQEAKSRTEEPQQGPSLELSQESSEEIGPVLTDEQKSRIQAMKPMTKEEWEARQSVIRKVVDPETGRMRLIKGDGEVLEEIVSRDKHREINKQATANDGLTFQMRSGILYD